MGREVRRVPPDWVHPKRKDGRDGLQPMYDESFAEAAKQWKEHCSAWENGYNAIFDRPRRDDDTEEFWEHDGDPPDRDYHRPDWPEDTRTHYQMYETTSEGTPISPVMETPEQLARWLADNGASAFAGQTASYEAWLRVAKGSYACSAIVSNEGIESGVGVLYEDEKAG